MAKKSSPRFEPNFEGASHDELRRELGFDDLTYEECFRELFGDVFPRRRAGGPVRVTQMGPGHRSRAKRGSETEVEPELDGEEK